MASIVQLLSELIGGESTSAMAAEWYMGGHSLREFRPSPAVGEQPADEARKSGVVEVEEKKAKEESFEDFAAVSRISVDVMWP
uniref:Uncharacterized protein n=1 Tax=Leersia perrieri TaxID=77586 RepID=A0A0D9UZD8_9ORYZ